MRVRRNFVLGVAGLMAGLAAGADHVSAQQGEAQISCVNPVGVPSWHFRIDYRGATVDANPAKITPAQISWFDPKDGGNYTLDRASGDLVGIVASSTGPHFRRGRCNLEKSK